MPRKRKESVPGPGKTLDGVSYLPGRAIQPWTDWKALEREFILNVDYAGVWTWLREVKKWPESRIKNGNTLEKIAGWGKKRASHQQAMTEALTKKHREEFAKLVPNLYEAKNLFVLKIIEDLKMWNHLNARDKKLVYEVIKNEIGEPTKITLNGMVPITGDPVQALLESYGLVKDGRIIDLDTEQEDAAENKADSQEITTVSN